jgi:carbamoyl-phosphate synthase small subunit
LPRLASNWRNRQPLGEYLRERKIKALAGIDTRRLTRLLREKGALNGCIIAGAGIDREVALHAGVAAAKGFKGLKDMDLAKVVTTRQSYDWFEGEWSTDTRKAGYTIQSEDTWPQVVAYDFGAKRNILRMLRARGCGLTIVPAQTSAREVLAMHPNGIFLSNGPGDPAACDYAIKSTRELLTHSVPIFGICLGHQILALASGAQCAKMKFGHHGANHPVEDLATRRVMITSQNHGFAVDESTMPKHLRATHRSLFDQTLQGIERTDREAFGFQGHPEASPGPHDVSPLFDRFMKRVREHQSSQKSVKAVARTS